MRDFPNVHLSENPAIKDLQKGEMGRSGIAGRSAAGAIELAHMRGFQGGYEQAMEDHKKGKMKKDNALKPHRSIKEG